MEVRRTVAQRAYAAPTPVGDRTTRRVLRAVTVVFAIAFLLHNGDHLRRGLDAVTPYVLWGGVALGVLSIAAIVFVAVDDRRAPAAAAVAGLLLAVGAGASHLLPEWSVLSDSLIGSSADGFTWFAVIAEVTAALAFGAAGWWSLRRTGAGYR